MTKRLPTITTNQIAQKCSKAYELGKAQAECIQSGCKGKATLCLNCIRQLVLEAELRGIQEGKASREKEIIEIVNFLIADIDNADYTGYQIASAVNQLEILKQKIAEKPKEKRNESHNL